MVRAPQAPRRTAACPTAAAALTERAPQAPQRAAPGPTAAVVAPRIVGSHFAICTSVAEFLFC